MSISFRNTPFTLGGNIYFATTATLAENVGYQRIEGLGYSSVGIAQNTRPNGTFSADFYLRSTDWGNLSALKGLVQVAGSLGGKSFSNGYMTEISLSIEPMSLVKASVRGIFFGTLSSGGGSGTLSTSIAPDSIFAHGASSTVSSVVSPLSVTYSYTQNISPVYEIGDYDIIGYKFEGAEIKINAQGAALQTSVHDLCDGKVTFTISLGTLCGGSFSGISEAGMTVINSSVSVNAGEDLVGSMELQKFI